jgi:uncharacterized 2Fe-2S/4Fe-4S cluster protein (DUF4445 family)
MDERVRVIFHPLNKVVTLRKGSTVLDAIRMAEIQFESICGGNGECKKCKVIFVRGSCTYTSPESTDGLLPEEITGNYCFACTTHIIGDCEFTIPVESRIDTPRILNALYCHEIHFDPSVEKFMIEINGTEHLSYLRSIRFSGYNGERPRISKEQYSQLVNNPGPATVTIGRTQEYPEVIDIEDGDTTDRNWGVAIDLGTTTVVGMLVDVSTGKVCASASTLNRQITFGEELVTRMSAVKDEGGKVRLQKAAVESINTVIDRMTKETQVPVSAIHDICVAGNTVMIYLITGRDPAALELANTPVSHGPVIARAGDLGLSANPNACMYCLPNVSRFVGGDAVGDIIASGMHLSVDLSLLIDLGTNGELVFGNKDWLASASCASGPAFEGAGITSGMRAMQGAIDHVSIDPGTSRVSWTTIGNERPRGICGSGIIDAAAVMFRSGILDFTGHLVEEKPGVREGLFGPEFVLVTKDLTATGHDIIINCKDIAYLMDSKAAVCGAIGVLMKKYRISVADVRQVFLAGAFGAYTDMRNVVAFGIIPRFFNATFHPLGNGSLYGACAALLSRTRRQEAELVARKIVYIDLLTDSDFIEEYYAAIYIPGKKEYFPE